MSKLSAATIESLNRAIDLYLIEFAADEGAARLLLDGLLKGGDAHHVIYDKVYDDCEITNEMVDATSCISPAILDADLLSLLRDRLIVASLGPIIYDSPDADRWGGETVDTLEAKIRDAHQTIDTWESLAGAGDVEANAMQEAARRKIARYEPVLNYLLSEK